MSSEGYYMVRTLRRPPPVTADTVQSSSHYVYSYTKAVFIFLDCCISSILFNVRSAQMHSSASCSWLVKKMLCLQHEVCVCVGSVFNIRGYVCVCVVSTVK